MTTEPGATQWYNSMKIVKKLLAAITIITIYPLLCALAQGSDTDDTYLSREHDLYRTIMRHYVKLVRPVKQSDHVINITMSMKLRNLRFLDGRTQTVEVNARLEQIWRDELLYWSPADYDNITALSVPSDSLWLPDIVLFNNALKFDQRRGGGSGYDLSIAKSSLHPSSEESGTGGSAIRTTRRMQWRVNVDYDGVVEWSPPLRLRASCEIDLRYFPFDRQICYFRFGSWSYNGHQVDIIPASTANGVSVFDTSSYIPHPDFELLSTWHKLMRNYYVNDEPWPEMVFYVQFKRAPRCQSQTCKVPFTVFLAPNDSRGKAILSSTVVLTYFVFLSSLAERMPDKYENMPFIVIYMTVLMLLAAASAVGAVAVLTINYSRDFDETTNEWDDEKDNSGTEQCQRLLKACYRNIAQIPPPDEHETMAEILIKAAFTESGKARARDPHAILSRQSSTASQTQMQRNLDERRMLTQRARQLLNEVVASRDSVAVRRMAPEDEKLQRAKELRAAARNVLQLLAFRHNMTWQRRRAMYKWRLLARWLDKVLFGVTLFATLLVSGAFYYTAGWSQDMLFNVTARTTTNRLQRS